MTAGPRQIAQYRADLLERLDAASQQLTVAVLHRQVYVAMRDEIVKRHPNADATFLNSYSAVHIRAQIMTIRRLADDHKDRPDSLYWIIGRIRSNPQIAARATLIDRLSDERPNDPDLVASIDAEWRRRWGAEVPEERALIKLQEMLEVEHVTAFADRNVAHADPRGSLLHVTYADVHAAIDHLADIANELNSMLRASVTDYSEVIITGDWHEPLRPSVFPYPMSMWEYPDPAGLS